MKSLIFLSLMLSDWLEFLLLLVLVFSWPLLSKTHTKSIWEYGFFSIWGGALVFLVLKMFVFESISGSGRSMQPTFPSQSVLLVDKSHYGMRVPGLSMWLVRFNRPNYNDIVLASSPNSEWVIKRVVAKEGDVVEILNEDLYVNGLKASLHFLKSQATNEHSPNSTRIAYMQEKVINVKSSRYKRWIIPKNQVFLVGDNLSLSYDSRDFGSVEESKVTGKVIGVWNGFGYSSVSQ